MGKNGELISVIIPVFNEAKVIDGTMSNLLKFLDSISEDSEILLIDDGSKDNSWEKICNYQSQYQSVKGVRLSRNFGHQAAVSAGLEKASGAAVVVLDADLQDPPEIIEAFLDKWREGYDVVYGIRQNRKENFLKRMSYSFFYSVLSKLSTIKIPRHAGDFSLMSHRVVKEITNMPERHRFVRGLRSWVGFKQIGIPYERKGRAGGNEKYDLKKLVNLALDGILSFSKFPLRVSSLIGVFTSIAGFGYLTFVLIYRFFGAVPPGWTTLIGLIVTLGGIQLLVLGVIGEYIGRIYDEIKRRPHYIIAETAPETKLN